MVTSYEQFMCDDMHYASDALSSEVAHNCKASYLSREESRSFHEVNHVFLLCFPTLRFRSSSSQNLETK